MEENRSSRKSCDGIGEGLLSILAAISLSIIGLKILEECVNWFLACALLLKFGGNAGYTTQIWVQKVLSDVGQRRCSRL